MPKENVWIYGCELGGENINNLLVLCPNCHAKKTYGIITIDENFNVYENNNKIEISNNHIKIQNYKSK